MDKPQPVLYPSDFDSRIWRAIEARLQADLAKARADLENQSLDDRPVMATRLRARIDLIKRYLRLPDDAMAAEQAARQDDE